MNHTTSTINSGALRSDGALVVWGDNASGQCNVPALPPGLIYTDFAQGLTHTVALRSDGQAIAFGSNSYGECNIPPLAPGQRYIDCDCIWQRTILLRSDGTLVASGLYSSGTMFNFPPIPSGLQYVEVAASYEFAALRSDGQIVHWGGAASPFAPLPPGVVYVEIAGGSSMTVARRSDGQIDAPPSYQTVTPPLLPGESYVGISADNVTVTGRVGPTSTYVTYASGCGGSRAPARLIPRDTPRIGATLRVRLFDLPQDIALMAFGWSRTPGPVSIDPLAMPGCAAHMVPVATYLLRGQNGQAVSELAIPSNLNLVGLCFYNQALVLDMTANAAGVVVSDAAQGVVGSW